MFRNFYEEFDILKEQEKMMKENQSSAHTETLKIKNYEEIRKEMLKKFNSGK